MKRIILPVLACGLAWSVQAASKPNMVYILADDLGYGDVQCLNPERGKIETPHMDRLAAEGMIFTDAHTSSSVCTPSRYGILTGRYNWRSHLQDGVVWGFSPPLIAAGRLTVAGFLKEQGYNTACFGKWHLGMTMPTTNGELPKGRKPKQTNIVWDGEIKGGPVDLGFDTFYGISASLDMAPYIWIENNRFVGALNNTAPIRPAPGFTKEQVLPTIGQKTIDYIEQQDGKKPFFIYVPLTSPHTPVIPTKEWQGRSDLGHYGDFVMQTDHVIGQIMAAVDASEFADNTIVIVTADNGCSKAAGTHGGKREGLAYFERQGHFPSAQFRGSKADLWDGGHRVPFIVRWPNGVKAATESDQTICLTDLMATCADLTGAALPENAAEDSVSFLPAFTGKPIISSRTGIIHHSISGHFAYRMGDWKLLLAKGSGGWTTPTEKEMAKIPDAPEGQLYNLAEDPGEQNNLYLKNPEMVETLLAQLKADIAKGRSTDGPRQDNDIPSENIKLWKGNVAK
ncbi:arylsulfatase [Pontiellaceae bacterium B1224]|nr:arylsulfatase [Pontiellaceae bacterium B1224]